MTTEDDFQRALDANPNDHFTRLVFADWLQDRDDPRAEGYRALGRLRKCPYRGTGYANYSIRGDDHSGLAWDWFDAARTFVPPDSIVNSGYGSYFYATSRREADEAAARGFAQLPAARRAALLALSVTAGAA